MPPTAESGCASECVAPRSFWNATPPIAAATNILPLYQQDGWKCGMVMLRGLLRRKSLLIEWTFTIAGSGMSIILFGALIMRCMKAR